MESLHALICLWHIINEETTHMKFIYCTRVIHSPLASVHISLLHICLALALLWDLCATNTKGSHPPSFHISWPRREGEFHTLDPERGSDWIAHSLMPPQLYCNINIMSISQFVERMCIYRDTATVLENPYAVRFCTMLLQCSLFYTAIETLTLV